uniref:Uncharacterized protein n=1 Tax=Aegilops tauschii TaxID=37682 RepID=M8C8N3_AEGTA
MTADVVLFCYDVDVKSLPPRMPELDWAHATLIEKIVYLTYCTRPTDATCCCHINFI